MKSLFLISLLILFFIDDFQAQIKFQKTYGAANNEYAHDVKQTSDGGYIFCGYTYSFGAGLTDVYLVKTDEYGDVQWTKTYGGTVADFGFSIMQTNDGGYIITGNTTSFGNGASDVYLIKVDVNGVLQWSKAYGSAVDDKGWSVQQTADGGYLILGQTSGYGAGSTDMYLLKVDANGNLLWTHTYGGVNSDEGYSVEQTTDYGYILCGRTKSFGAGNMDIYLIKTDIVGNVAWTKTFGGANDDEGRSVKQTTDGGYIITGETSSFGAGQADGYLIKTDGSGNIQWSKTYGGNLTDYGNFIDQNVDGGYIFTGHTFSFGAGNVDVYLIRTDAAGNEIWSRAIGEINGDQGYAVIQTTHKEFMIAGHTNNFGNGQADYYLIKADTNGKSGCNEAPASSVISPFSPQIGTGVLIGNGGLGMPVTTIEATHVLQTNVVCYSCKFDYSGMTLQVDSVTCNGYNDGQATVVMVGGAGPFKFLWNPGGQTTDTATALSPGTYSVQITDTNGCDTTLNFNVYEPPPLTVILQGDSEICGGDTAVIIASGGDAYQWSSGDTTDTIMVFPLSTTDYIVTVYDGICFEVDTFNVAITALIPHTQITGDNAICAGDTATLIGNGAGSYLWNTTETSQSISVSPPVTTTYWLAATNACGSDTDSAQVVVNPLPLANAGNDTNIFVGDVAFLQAKGGLEYLWGPPEDLSCITCPDPVASPSETTTYYVTVTDQFGCTAIDEVTVYIDKEVYLFVPSAFSPNNDGQNDILYVRGRGIKSVEFVVYDRWGERVFETNDYKIGWDGTYKSEPLNSAVFMYYVKALFKDGSERMLKGNVTLVR